MKTLKELEERVGPIERITTFEIFVTYDDTLQVRFNIAFKSDAMVFSFDGVMEMFTGFNNKRSFKINPCMFSTIDIGVVYHRNLFEDKKSYLFTKELLENVIIEAKLTW